MNTTFNEYKGRIDLSALIDGCREKGRLYHYAKGEIFVREGEVGRYGKGDISGNDAYNKSSDALPIKFIYK